MSEHHEYGHAVKHWSTVQHKLVPQIICTSCDWRHWSTHHAEDPSWFLLNIELLNRRCCLRSGMCGRCIWCNWTRRRTRNFFHGLHLSLPTLTRVVSPFSTRSAVALETGICSWLLSLFLVLFLCLSFLFLFLSHCLCRTRCSCCTNCFLRTFANFCHTFLCHNPSCLCLFSCPSSLRLPSVLGRDHHPQPPSNSSMQLEELRNLFDSELANTSWLVPEILTTQLHTSIFHWTLHLSPSGSQQSDFPIWTVSCWIHPWFESRIPEDSCTRATTSQSSLRTPCSVCASSQSHACDSQFSQHPEPRSCTPWLDSCTTLCPTLRSGTASPSSPGALAAWSNHSSAVSYRKPNQLRNTHSKCLHSRLSPEKSEGLPNSLDPLSSTDCQRAWDCCCHQCHFQPFSDCGLMTLISKVWHCFDQDSRPAECACSESVSMMINLLNDSYWKQTHATCTTQHTDDWKRDSETRQRIDHHTVRKYHDACATTVHTCWRKTTKDRPHIQKKRHMTQKVTVSRFPPAIRTLDCFPDVFACNVTTLDQCCVLIVRRRNNQPSRNVTCMSGIHNSIQQTQRITFLKIWLQELIPYWKYDTKNYFFENTQRIEPSVWKNKEMNFLFKNYHSKILNLLWHDSQNWTLFSTWLTLFWTWLTEIEPFFEHDSQKLFWIITQRIVF